MKARQYELSFLFMSLVLFITSLHLNAQVTIGSHITPNNGALLDLKEEYTEGGEANAKKGLGLPRVKITEKYSLKDVIEGYESLPDADKKNLSTSHIGLVVYNMNQFVYEQCYTSQSGVMVWSGDDGWQNILKYSGEYQGDLASRRSDSLALVNIYNSTGGANWSASKKKNWLTDKPLHEWSGVVIEKNTDGTSKLCGRVIELNLMNGNLTGTIPDDIWDLTALNALKLSYNYVSIALSEGLPKLKDLEVLYLSKITLSEGKIPTSIGQLTKLRFLAINDNAGSLAGSTIPIEITNLKNLEEMVLDKNNLAGAIPLKIVNLTKLSLLNLEWNKLTGSIPEDIGKLTNMVRLNLSHNQLSGTIPASVGELKKVYAIYFNHNQLAGEIPKEIGNMTALKDIHLTKNQLTSISLQLGMNAANNALSITTFYADSNKIANLPKELALMPNLELIDLGVNDINHAIPVEIAKISKLKYLLLNENKITGSIPVELGSRSELLNIKLNNNLLTGGIPQELGNAPKLSHLNLNFNMGIKGELPASLGNIQTLTNLEVAQCGLVGTIPSRFANLTNLKVFNASQNDFTGSLPTFFVDLPNLITLKLHYCKFEGEIPTVYNNLKNINNTRFELEIHSNRLSGDVPINIISLVNRQPSLSQATEDNPIRATICPQYREDGTVSNKPFNNFDACMSKP